MEWCRDGNGETTRPSGRISYRTVAWLAWSLCALSLALTVLSLLLLNLNLSHLDTPTYSPWLGNTLGAISYAPIGALIRVVRETMQPEHVSIWLRPDTAPRDRRAD